VIAGAGGAMRCKAHALGHASRLAYDRKQTFFSPQQVRCATQAHALGAPIKPAYERKQRRFTP
jgi:hypothetical protein